MYLFFEENISETTEYFNLSEEESRHCCKVMRLGKGSQVMVINGKGGLFTCEITEANFKKTGLKVMRHENKSPKKNYSIHIAIAPTKNNDRIEWFIEKSVEIGIDRISFILSQNSERKVLKLDRLKKIALSAMKQSYAYDMPKIHELVKLPDFLASIEKTSFQKFLAHEAQDPDQTLFKKAIKGSNYLILIGPEGGFSEEEVAQARQEDFEIVSLGEKRLRTETAGVVSCTTLNLLNQI
ncbi:16S rRNA (uracil(1498)-N(3))-methyltransferase [Flammeovirgaceae bacterium SG7u.111]|nr:16S rRNA (uracil(1498)-N(3))-methyltransferase [Flammeovirgaceae bacterium SG7u.132]WPO38439.1 16S rRNA (uracil(1498)-N(3))-methyltransferase [Flammeovirgaceae bacterium SG7u.111]